MKEEDEEKKEEEVEEKEEGETGLHATASAPVPP